MSHHYIAENADEMAKIVARDLLRIGTPVTVGRVGKIIELRNLCYDILKPRERLLSYKILRQSKIWAYSEVMTEFLGLNPPLTEYYITDPEVKKFMKTFHRSDGRANYTYGERWHVNQSFQRILKRLRDDPHSRQAVITIYDSSLDLDENEWNIPCTISHQFFVRHSELDGRDKLNLTVHMRSNDLFKGWKYDIFLNSFILEAFAGFLGYEVGTLTFFVGSFHVYEKDIPLLERFVEEEGVTPTKYLLQSNAPISFKLSFDALYHQLWTVKHIEEASRHGKAVPYHQVIALIPYFRDWAETYITWNDKNRT